MAYKIKKIYIENKVKADPLTIRLMSRLDAASVVFGDEADLKRVFGALSLYEGKRSIFLTEAKGKLLKDCPGMQEPYLCCRLQVLSPISNCPIYCSYCFLQFYLNNPITTIYTNLQAFKEEVTNLSRSQPKRLFRITTGELSDSLALDRETGISAELIKAARSLPNVLLELKTKTNFVDHLLGLDHGNKVVFSWSLNAQEIVKKEEHLSSSLKDRIKAAKKLSKKGYLLGFHFDPLIWYSSWEKDYEDVIELLFNEIKAERVAWISLGTLRFAAGMENEIKRFFPKSKLPYGEFIKASDGKMRYIKPIRFELYQKTLSWIRKYGGDELFVYLCMEMPDAWKEVMDFVPQSKARLDYLFAESIHRRFENVLLKSPKLADYV
jgi:spore photoproduct lyase